MHQVRYNRSEMKITNNLTPQLTVLKCGCTVNESSGKLYEECVPHKKADFIQ